MAYIAQLPAFEIEKRRLCIRLSGSHATAWATATQLLIYFEALNRHLKSFVRVALYKTTPDIWSTFDVTFVQTEGLLHASHEWV